MNQKISSYIELTKPRIALMVLVTAYLGYYLGVRSQDSHMTDWSSWLLLLYLLIGTCAASAGSAVLNQVFEHRHDAKMARTKNRPIVTGEVAILPAMIFGIILSVAGITILYFFTNPITAGISAATILLYILIYTPSKRISTWNTIIGSVPGALPPVGGWTAATGELAAPAWILFGILFCWQMPHFLAIAIIYAADYEKGGFKMLPNIYPESKRTSYIILFFTIALLITSLGLYIIKIGGLFYAVGAAILGMVFLVYALQIIFHSTKQNARKLMLVSIIYLPLLLIIILIERILN
ncbi:MAG: heme o synthase [Candidatus Marinimicrobia bacterium]|nr:heme o synthase [Candidatus Neomarinimicrobiota bacterium]MDP6936089.1 heme o synthase [Candidatus Neomarinimicrobiota bacterium]